MRGWAERAVGAQLSTRDNPPQHRVREVNADCTIFSSQNDLAFSLPCALRLDSGTPPVRIRLLVV